MAALRTQKQDIEILAGQTLTEQFNCFQDDAFTIAFNLADYTLEAVLAPPHLDASSPLTLTSGNGLTIDADNGIVQLKGDTTGWDVGRGEWYLKATDGEGVISYPLRGVLYVGNP